MECNSMLEVKVKVEKDVETPSSGFDLKTDGINPSTIAENSSMDEEEIGDYFISGNDDESRKYCCTQCQDSFDTKEECDQHISKHYQEPPTQEDPFKEIKIEAGSETSKEKRPDYIVEPAGDRPFSCTHCGTSFANLRQIKTHVNTHYKFKCLTCPSEKFLTAEALEVHMLCTHLQKPTKFQQIDCDFCDGILKHGETANTHMLKHKIDCIYCAGFLKPGETALSHKAKHKSEFKFQCDECKSLFLRFY